MRICYSVRHGLSSLLLAAAILFNLGMMAEAAEIVIFHTNDMHARAFSEDDGNRSAGLAELAAIVKAGRAANRDTLWLDAGDTFHGMPYINISKGENMVQLLNKAGLDATVPGNHDFNYGSQQLERLAKGLKGTVLSANVVRKGTKELVFKDYRIFKMSDGTTVGVFGMTTPETAYKTNPSNVRDVEFLNPVETARRMVGELRDKCDVLVALMHMGVDQSSEFTSERIAHEVSGIDVIVDGHSHTELPEGIWVNDTLIVQTGWHDYNLGKVTIQTDNHKISSRKAELIEKNEMHLKPDSQVKKTLDNIEKKNRELFDEVVAKSERKLTGDRLIVRRQEAEMGNLCSDAIRWRTGADIAVINGGSIRSDLPEGNVTKGDVMAIFPFGNTVKMAEIKGQAIKAMLEHSVYGYPASFGGFLDVSGMTFAFDPLQPVGSRVSDIKIEGQPLDEGRTYRIATNDYLLSGGDDFEMLKNLPIAGEFDTCEDVLADYLNKVGMPDIQVGRIDVKNELPPVQADLEEGGVNRELPESKAA